MVDFSPVLFPILYVVLSFLSAFAAKMFLIHWSFIDQVSVPLVPLKYGRFHSNLPILDNMQIKPLMSTLSLLLQSINLH